MPREKSYQERDKKGERNMNAQTGQTYNFKPMGNLVCD